MFNDYETELFYELFPNKTLTFKDETCTSGRVKENISGIIRKRPDNNDFLCNMDGNEKLKF